MYSALPPDDDPPFVAATGHLAAPPRVEALVQAAYPRCTGLDEGKVADCIPALANVPRELFGISIVGVGGGIVTISPGKGRLGVFSPPLVAAGNSVRAPRVTQYLSEHLGLNLFASQPV